MSAAQRSTPERSCIGCRQRRAALDLVRVTSSNSLIVVDGSSDGRGAWLCRGDSSESVVAPGCLDQALARRAFARAWKCDSNTIDESAIRAALVSEAEHPDAH